MIKDASYVKTYMFIKGFAMGLNLQNTLIALTVAERLHDGQFRNGGDPYLVHPLKVCSKLIACGIKDDDILSAALLHDVKEDCNITSKELKETYHLSDRTIMIIEILTKDIPDNLYYKKIQETIEALLIKLSDRCNNVSTMQPFTYERMQKYINETYELALPLCSHGKAYYPEYSNAITLMKEQIVSNCEMAQFFLNIVTKEDVK